MEWLAALLSWFETNKALSLVAAALWGLWLYLRKQRSERMMKRYDKTLEYYEAFSCQLFTCLASGCKKEELKAVEWQYTVTNSFGEKVDSKDSAYTALLCGAGRATLVADPRTRQLITKLTLHLTDVQSQQAPEVCQQTIRELVKSMNEHLISLESGCVDKAIFDAESAQAANDDQI